MDNMQGQWCSCRGVMLFPNLIGKIEEESEHSALVRYSEGQLYSSQVWDKKYLERFKRLDDAIKKFAEETGESLSSVTQLLFTNFTLNDVP